MKKKETNPKPERTTELEESPGMAEEVHDRVEVVGLLADKHRHSQIVVAAEAAAAVED